MYLTLSPRGSQLLVLNGYKYEKSELTRIGLYWRCTHSSCNACLITDKYVQKVLAGPGIHLTHPPEKSLIISEIISDFKKGKNVEKYRTGPPKLSQALALTHKASPPSRPSSEPSLPRSPQSSSSSVTAATIAAGQHVTNNQSQNSHSQPTALITSIHTQQSQQKSQNSPINVTHQTPYAAHGQHLKQEINSNTKQEGFDLSKTTSGTGKSLPVHCIVEAVHSLSETRNNNLKDNWRRSHIEMDTYVFIPTTMPFHELVQESLMRLGYTNDLILSSRGSIVIRNWKPLAIEKIADNLLLTVGDILAELINLATLKIKIYRSRPPPPNPTIEIRDKLLRLLLIRSHPVLVAAGCPLDETTLTSICRGTNDITEETQRNFDNWLQQQHLSLSLNPLLPVTNHHRNQSPPPIDGTSNIPGSGSLPAGALVPSAHHHHSHHPGLLSFSHKSRMRTSFDPELELPRLQRWFSENQHPTRQQIQHYVTELNSLDSRRDRKPLHVNNVIYWFKNARAAQKRAENRGVNGYSPPGLSPRNASNVSEDGSDEEEDSRLQSTSPSPCPPPSPPLGPLSLTTKPEDQQPQPPTSTTCSLKQEEPRVSSGSEDDEPSPTGPISGFSLVPSPMFSHHSVMYMSHYLSPRGPTGCPSSMLDERRKRNRTFIDPVTEVPRLETWFTHNTHPSHALILKYTDELNRMPYRQKFPRLEPKNVQFWFKNRRAKCKRLKMALFDAESPQTHHQYHQE